MSRTPENDHNSARPDTSGHEGTPAPSTTWGYKRVRIAGNRRTASKKVAGGGRWRSLERRNPREKLTLVVHYRGGAECWYEVRARGSWGRFHGATALHDMLSEINRGREYWNDRWRPHDDP